MAIHTIWMGPLFTWHPTFTTYYRYLSLLWKMTGTSVQWAWITPPPLCVPPSLFSPGWGRLAATEMWFSAVSFSSNKRRYTLSGKNMCGDIKYMQSGCVTILNIFTKVLRSGQNAFLFTAAIFRPEGIAKQMHTHSWCCVFFFCRLYSMRYAFLEPKCDPGFSPETSGFHLCQEVL